MAVPKSLVSAHPLHAHKRVWTQARLAHDGHVAALPTILIGIPQLAGRHVAWSCVSRLVSGEPHRRRNVTRVDVFQEVRGCSNAVQNWLESSWPRARGLQGNRCVERCGKGVSA